MRTTGRIVGLLTPENISEVIMINTALGHNRGAAVTAGLKMKTKV